MNVQPIAVIIYGLRSRIFEIVSSIFKGDQKLWLCQYFPSKGSGFENHTFCHSVVFGQNKWHSGVSFMTFDIELLILRLVYGLIKNSIILNIFNTFKNTLKIFGLVIFMIFRMKPYTGVWKTEKGQVCQILEHAGFRTVSETTFRAQNSKLGRECEVRILIWTRS